MIIDTNFNPDGEIWFIVDNVIKHDIIVYIRIILRNCHKICDEPFYMIKNDYIERLDSVSEISYMFKFGGYGNFYCNGIFKTKEELLKSL